jgi:hypothetical protein
MPRGENKRLATGFLTEIEIIARIFSGEIPFGFWTIGLIREISEFYRPG